MAGASRSPASVAVEPGSWARLEAALDPQTGSIALDARAPARTAAGDGRGAASSGLAAGARARRRARCCSAPSAATAAASGRTSTASSTGPAIAVAVPAASEPVAAWALGEGRGSRVVDARSTRPARPLRQRPAASRHRPQLDRRRSRLAPRAGAVRGDALPLRRDRRPRLGAEPRSSSCPKALAERRLRASSSPPASVEDLVPFVVRRAAGRRAGRRRRAPADLHLPGLLVRARAPRRAGTAGPEDDWVARHGLRSLYDRYDGRLRRLRGVASGAR